MSGRLRHIDPHLLMVLLATGFMVLIIVVSVVSR